MAFPVVVVRSRMQGWTPKQPITSALTALLIVQVTFYGTVTDTIRRIVSVLAGVALAVAAALLVGLTWWSLGSIVLVSILVGQALRLGPHLLEVPISAMLILAAGGAGVRATDRVVETLIGAAVGLLVTVLIPQRPRVRTAGLAVERFGDSIARLLDRAASLAAATARCRRRGECLAGRAARDHRTRRVRSNVRSTRPARAAGSIRAPSASPTPRRSCAAGCRRSSMPRSRCAPFSGRWPRAATSTATRRGPTVERRVAA